MITLAEKIIDFNKHLEFKGNLPNGISIMNPFREKKDILEVSSSFYKKYYNDNKPRHLILGINPGRFGAGVTGVPFTDAKRLTNECGIKYSGKETHEPSSVFIYEMIKVYGGTKRFYHNFYINAVCPLGFIISDSNGKQRNYNYYDSRDLTIAVSDFIVENIRKQIKLGIASDICFCLGTGKNEKYLRLLNNENKFFENIIALEHPRYIMQYKAKSKEYYIEKYIKAFSTVR